jgi:hypothetical protein
MALNQVGLERLNTATTDKIGKSKNLIINGAMQVAQRGTSSTTSGYGSVDRFHIQYNAGTRTHSQTAITSGSPYENGFRNVLRITNTTVGGGAGSSGITNAFQYLEAQDVANSGWNYTSSSSFVTLSFWVRSSVAQEFYGYLRTFDGTEQAYCFSTGSLSANTWTKITKTIPGNSNITINNDNGAGLQVNISPFWGGDFTTSGKTTDSWAAFSGANRTPDYATTWASTASATFDITGVQLEVGSVATDFEHKSFGQDLALSQRYYQRYREGNNISLGLAFAFGTNEVDLPISFIVPMRTAPSIDQNVSTSGYVGIENDSIGGSQYVNNNFTLQFGSTNGCNIYADPSPTLTVGQACHLTLRNAAAYVAFNAEL